MDNSGSAKGKRVKVQKGVKWEKGVGGDTLRQKVLGFVWTNWLLYRIGRTNYVNIYIYIYKLYIKYMGGLGWVGFGILWPKPNLTCYQKNFCNPTHQALKTSLTRRVGLVWVEFDGLASWLHTLNGRSKHIDSETESCEALVLQYRRVSSRYFYQSLTSW